jgi:hypothetical protein
VERFAWHRRGRGLRLDLAWSRPRPVHLALADAVSAVLRARMWDQFSGQVPALDRDAWLRGSATWPQGHLLSGHSHPEPDASGRPLGPYAAPAPPAPGGLPSLLTAVANPYGRVLLGPATPYLLTTDHDRLVLRAADGRVPLRLSRSQAPEAAVAAADIRKYAVVTVEGGVPHRDFATGALRVLAACGMVFTAPDACLRAELARLGLVVVSDGSEVDDLRGYALSVGAARRMAINADAALRRTRLAGAGALALPTVSVLLPSLRPDRVEACVTYLAGQDYPALEVLIGLHGYDVPEDTRRRWAARLGVPLRVCPFPAELTLGGVLGPADPGRRR